LEDIRELEVQKEPQIFKLIQAHLRGYDILPLSDEVIPYYLTKETMIHNLFKEAQFYGLDLLCQKIRDYQKKGSKERKYMFAVSTR